VIFVVTIDTEADRQWDHGAPLTTQNVGYWEPFQAVCDKHGITPTYLITSEIAADPLAQKLLRAWTAQGTAEVGAHLHPWTTPPFLDRPGMTRNDVQHAFLSELPDELVSQKLDSLTREIEKSTGIRPISFRAGRFGFDTRVARELGRLGYTVDSSVTPLTEWSGHAGLHGGAGGPDFRSHGTGPFMLQGTGSPGVLEIPITIVATYPVLRRSPRLLRLYQTLPVRAARKILFRHRLCPQPVWLRPTPEFGQSDLQNVWRAAEDQRSPVAVMMFHSSELMPGGSPYRPTPASVNELLALLDEFFGFARTYGAVPATLSAAAAQLMASGSLEERRL
jgi:hypothetical protein